MRTDIVKDDENDVNSFANLSKLSDEDQKQLISWCRSLKQLKTLNTSVTTYGIKHVFERTEDGFYVTNGQMKGALLVAGFQFDNVSYLNPHVNVSKKSLNERSNI